jgi:hypothetical protein
MIRVRLDFLEETMRGKGFPQKWISWVMQSVKEGQVCINVNGERSAVFLLSLKVLLKRPGTME